ncbi:FHA domain-containing protein, partial [Mycobacterium sp. Marseille-P9652]|uniref:FHA domain-containing protein n=1 Tax=Mycobacterium sp. Marseille-P9652 TaxID=2654950 RepID=UPI00351A3F1C
MVNRPAPPVLTVRYDGSQRSFAPGYEVIIGRDAQADVRIADPRISRAHLIVRFDQGRWLAIDNGSLNGTYLNGYRMPVVDIHDGQSIHVGNPQGPCLTFAIGPQQGQTSRPRQTRLRHDSGPPTLAWSALPEQTNPIPPRGNPGGAAGAAGRGGRGVEGGGVVAFGGAATGEGEGAAAVIAGDVHRQRQRSRRGRVRRRFDDQVRARDVGRLDMGGLGRAPHDADGLGDVEPGKVHRNRPIGRTLGGARRIAVP